MQFTVERDAFLKELSRVIGVIEKKSTIPILSNVLLDAGARNVLLRATDLEIQAETPCPAEVSTQGVTTVDGRLLHDAVKRSSEGCTVSMKLDEARGRLMLSAGRMRFDMLVLAPENFPSLDLPSGEDVRSFLMPAADLRALIEATRFAVSTDAGMSPALHGIYLHAVGTRLAAAACDRPCMSLKSVALPAGAEGMAGVSLPKKLTGELLRCLPEKGDVALEISKSRIVVTIAECRIVSNLFAGIYPQYELLVPQSAHTLVLDRKRFIQGIERVSLALDEKDVSVSMLIEADGLSLACRSNLRGMALDEFDAVVDGPHIEIHFNHRILRSCLDAIAGERLVISYQDNAAGVLFRAEPDEEMTHRVVVMPMQVPAIQQEREAA